MVGLPDLQPDLGTYIRLLFAPMIVSHTPAPPTVHVLPTPYVNSRTRKKQRKHHDGPTPPSNPTPATTTAPSTTGNVNPEPRVDSEDSPPTPETPPILWSPFWKTHPEMWHILSHNLSKLSLNTTTSVRVSYLDYKPKWRRGLYRIDVRAISWIVVDVASGKSGQWEDLYLFNEEDRLQAPWLPPSTRYFRL
jgi:hypothetical protein